MQKKVPVLDTNIIIRFLTADDKEQADKIEKLFTESAEKGLEIPDLVIAEIVYVLLSFYKLSKKEVIEKIEILLEFERFLTNKKVIKQALGFYKKHNISFVDAYICSLVFNKKNKHIYTFDKKILNIKEIATEKP